MSVNENIAPTNGVADTSSGKDDKDWWSELAQKTRKEHWKYMVVFITLQYFIGSKVRHLKDIRKRGDDDVLLGIHVFLGGSLLFYSSYLLYIKLFLNQKAKEKKIEDGISYIMDMCIHYHPLLFYSLILSQIANKILPLKSIIPGFASLHRRIGFILLLLSGGLAIGKIFVARKSDSEEKP